MFKTKPPITPGPETTTDTSPTDKALCNVTLLRHQRMDSDQLLGPFFLNGQEIRSCYDQFRGNVDMIYAHSCFSLLTSCF